MKKLFSHFNHRTLTSTAPVSLSGRIDSTHSSNVSKRIIVASISIGLSMLGGCETNSESRGAETALAKIASVGISGDAAKERFNALRSSADVSGNEANRPRITCDSIGELVICTDGKSVCWWGPIRGYGCSF